MSQKIELQTTGDDTPIDEIQVGISSCLLGQEVRFDGGHKRDTYITGTLLDYFEFVPVCPEAAVGLGIPRAATVHFNTFDRTRRA